PFTSPTWCPIGSRTSRVLRARACAASISPREGGRRPLTPTWLSRTCAISWAACSPEQVFVLRQKGPAGNISLRHGRRLPHRKNPRYQGLPVRGHPLQGHHHALEGG